MNNFAYVLHGHGDTVSIINIATNIVSTAINISVVFPKPYACTLMEPYLYVHGFLVIMYAIDMISNIIIAATFSGSKAIVFLTLAAKCTNKVLTESGYINIIMWTPFYKECCE